MLPTVAMDWAVGCRVSGIKGVSAGFCTGMPVRESHCQTADGHATPSPRHLFSSVCIPAFLCMGVFRKMVQREFLPCKMSHPFTSPKEAKAAKFSALKWKECWIGSQHKIRSAPSSATGEQDPALQNAFFYLWTPDCACYGALSLEAVQNTVCLSPCV